MEEFALAADRAKALAQLVPGSEDYYYYHALHCQHSGRLGDVAALLEAWEERHGASDRREEIVRRQSLLTYEDNPRATLEHIRYELGVLFDHQRESEGQETSYPSQLDPARIGRDALAKQALHAHSALAGFTDHALPWLADTELDDELRRHLLQRLIRPDHPRLVDLVDDDLGYRHSGGFGSLPIHDLLLLDQLDELASRRPALRKDGAFINAWMKKLQPGPDVAWESDPAARSEYLDRLWSFVADLAPAFNALKVHVLYHRLDHDQRQGIYDHSRFIAYLQLPRRADYVAPEYLKLRQHRDFVASFGAGYDSVTLLEPVTDDEELVRGYLANFLAEAEDYTDLTTYVRSEYLKVVFATTKILRGIGDMEQHYSTLANPALYLELKDRVDIDFAATNPDYFAADAEVSLDLYIKNVATLVVKVFEISTLNYYLATGSDVESTIDLDGLVASEETTYDYDEAPLRRVRRRFDFAALTRPGVYVVEFVGNGRSSRALIRKGRLGFVERIGAAGHVFTVLDERKRVVTDAEILLAGHEYRADESGAIAVPFTANPGQQQILLRRGDVTTLESFYHQAERYSFTAGIYVDRESLIAGEEARLLVRSTLSINGVPISLDLLEDVVLAIEVTDRHDVSSTMEVPNFALHSDRECTHDFKVPEDSARLSFTVRAKVARITTSAKVDLSASRSFELNQIDASSEIEDLHLSRTDQGFMLYLLGKNGEARPQQPVNIAVQHRDFNFTVNLTLQTDERGRVALGELVDIAMLQARSPAGVEERWFLTGDRCRYPATIHGRAGEVVTLPYVGSETRVASPAFSLLERRGDTYLRDCASAMSLAAGELRISGLPAGDYALCLTEHNVNIELRLSAGQASTPRWLCGDARILEVQPGAPLTITAIDVDDDEVAIRLGNVTKYARVHLLATRFVPAYSAAAELDRIPAREPRLVDASVVTAEYLSGRDIGDEYRYILERKYAKRYPGVMLSRPGLLLNPWAVRDTDTDIADITEGTAYERQDAKKKSKGRPRGRAPARPQAMASPRFFANLDFLARPAVIMTNLRADDTGVVKIARADLTTISQLRIIAIDPRSTIYREVALAEVDRGRRDLRLDLALDSAAHFTEKRQITSLPAGGELTVRDISTSEVEKYDTLAKVYALYTTLSGDSTLTEFEFTMRWPDLDDSEKRRLYSTYAGHELNLFLANKDPEFFAAVIKPYLANKRAKTFLDHYLLDDDLGAFLTPWAFARLNIVERILLTRRVAGRRGNGSRHASDLFDLLPVDIERDNHLFDTALMGSALATDDDMGLEREKGAVRAAAKSLSLAMPMGSAGGMVPPPAPACAPMPEPQPMMLDEICAKEEEEADLECAVDDDSFGMGMAKRDARGRSEMRAFYEKLDQTQEWAENNYYHLEIDEQGPELVTVNAFWRDFARHDGSSPFLSTNFAVAAGSFTEMLLALAVLDLPFAATTPAVDFAGARMTLRAATPLVLFHKEIMATAPSADKVPILVSQNYFRADDRYRYEGGEQFDKYVGDEFLVHTVYLAQVVLTNPTSSRQKLDLLLQIPRAAMAVSNGFETRGMHVQLEPYATRSIEYAFYFPVAGEFTHYPVHVAKNQELIAFASPAPLQVVDKLSEIDRSSWAYLSQHGDTDQVIAYLGDENIDRLDLDRIAWRMREPEVYQRTIELLASRHVYNHTLWSYSLRHGDIANLREYLLHEEDFVDSCGLYLESTPLAIDPVLRHRYQHLAYAPLVNARAHRLGARHQILNDTFAEQYEQLMDLLCYRPQLDSSDLVEVAYYLLLQDRTEEGLATLDRVACADVATRLQCDYLRAYAAFLTDQPETARALAEPYRDHPVDRWRKLFASVLAQLDEAAGGAVAVIDEDSRDQRQAALTATATGFDFNVDKGAITINYQNLSECWVNYYPMDIELLFSRQPFVQQQSEQFAFIKPNRSDLLALPANASHTTMPLPEEYRGANVIVEIVAGGERKSQAYYAHQLIIQLIANYGQVQVAHRDDQRPLPRTYVKVYARMADGSVSFYKDGYTDLRGKFDYASLSTDELDRVSRFAVLVLNDDFGAAIREAAPPKR